MKDFHKDAALFYARPSAALLAVHRSAVPHGASHHRDPRSIKSKAPHPADSTSRASSQRASNSTIGAFRLLARAPILRPSLLLGVLQDAASEREATLSADRGHVTVGSHLVDVLQQLRFPFRRLVRRVAQDSAVDQVLPGFWGDQEMGFHARTGRYARRSTGGTERRPFMKRQRSTRAEICAISVFETTTPSTASVGRVKEGARAYHWDTNRDIHELDMPTPIQLQADSSTQLHLDPFSERGTNFRDEPRSKSMSDLQGRLTARQRTLRKRQLRTAKLVDGTRLIRGAVSLP